MPEETRWKDLYEHLKLQGFDVYSPAQHTGECTSPYIVIRDAGTSQYLQFSSEVTLYELLCYVPVQKYSSLQGYVKSVKEAMKSLWPMFIPMNYETPPFYDDTVKAHMTAIQYRNIRYTPKGGMR